MTTVLVVDDSAVDRHLAGGLLRKRGLTPVFASHGREALELIDRDQPDIVVTDLQMPEMDGLELTGAIRRRFPFLPVVLMTAHGSEEIAVQALQRGAASYVAKRNLAHELADTVGSVLELAAASRNEERLLSFLTRTESHFEIDSDMASITPWSVTSRPASSGSDCATRPDRSRSRWRCARRWSTPSTTATWSSPRSSSRRTSRSSWRWPGNGARTSPGASDACA